MSERNERPDVKRCKKLDEVESESLRDFMQTKSTHYAHVDFATPAVNSFAEECFKFGSKRAGHRSSPVERFWINQPSTSQPLHAQHGMNVLAAPFADGQHVVYCVSGDVISTVVPSECLSPGWNEYGTEQVSRKWLAQLRREYVQFGAEVTRLRADLAKAPNLEWTYCANKAGPREVSRSVIFEETMCLVTDGDRVGVCGWQQGHGVGSPWASWSNYGDIQPHKIIAWIEYPKAAPIRSKHVYAARQEVADRAAVAYDDAKASTSSQRDDEFDSAGYYMPD